MIKEITELNFPKINGKQYATMSQATISLQDMAEKTITSQIKISGDITPDFSYDWEVEYKGEKYIMPLRHPQGAKEDTTTQSTVDLTFHHWAIYQLKRWYFFTIQSVESGVIVPDKYMATVSLNLKDFCQLYGQVLEYYFGDKITIDLCADWEYDNEPTVVEISNSYNWDILIKLYELYGVRWQIEPNGDIDHYVIKVGYPTTEVTHVFEYGFKGGLIKLEQQVQDENIRNMIIGRGGSQNLPYRYFKKHDKENATFSADPDWIPELQNIYFAELRGATFRSYIQGWKARHIEEYRKEYPKEEWVVTTPTADKSYAPWAWKKGYNDEEFNPIEYVKDDESIKRYGELMGGLDNNDDIHPTIQGVTIDNLGRIDEVVAVSEIVSDKIDEEIETGVSIPPQCVGTIPLVPANSYKSFKFRSIGTFRVPEGRIADLDVNLKVLSAKDGSIELNPNVNAEIKPGSQKVTVINFETKEERTASGIPAGLWSYIVSGEVHNLSDKRLTIEVGDTEPRLVDSTAGVSPKNTWEIWIKNIWGSEKLADESDIEYAERVWTPILGDKENNEAKIAFTDGMLASSEDYEFTIVAIPTYDTTKELEVEINTEFGDSVAIYQSHWKLTLAKNDADLDATGVLLPSTMRFAQAGNHFVFVGIDMPHLYVTEAEKRLDDWKKDELDKIKDIKPTIVVSLDKVRIFNQGKPDALIDSLKVGNSLRVADKRFIVTDENEAAAYEILYLQSVTYTYNEPTDTEANILPDVQVVLSDKYEVSANVVSQLSGEVTALQKQIGSVSNVAHIVRSIGDTRYLRKDLADRAAGRIEFMQGFDSDKQSTFRSGAQFGTDFAEGETGFGGKINERGDAWLGGLHLRNFLEVPELRYNRTEISIGNAWNAPGGGIIERVTPDYNADGTIANTGTITLHLENGEIGAVAVGDLCQGIFHDATNIDNNATANSDDGYGNFLFAGFCSVYFRITAILDSGRNSEFRYELRPTTAKWKYLYHPIAQMHFVGYGNTSDKERQTSRYATRTYQRYLKGVNKWEFGADNIAAQFGDLSNLSLFGIDMSGYSAYLNNIYMTGRIEQIDVSLRMELNYGNDNFISEGATRTITCRVYRGWEDVTDRVTMWVVRRETSNTIEDTTWMQSAKAQNFNGEITLDYSDLGTTNKEFGATFTFGAQIDEENYAINSVTMRPTPISGGGESDPPTTAVTIVSQAVAYQVSMSGTVPPTGIWSPNIPSVPSGQYLWTMITVTYSDGTSVTSYSVAYQGANGENGVAYTENLCVGSEFPVATKWAYGAHKANVTIDNTHTYQGRNSIKNNQSGITANEYNGLQQTFTGLTEGETYTASIWVYCEDLTTIDNASAFELQVFDDKGNRVATGWQTGQPKKENEWQQLVCRVTAPEGAVSLKFHVYVRTNGVIWYSSPKLERGNNLNPTWSPNPADKTAEIITYYYLSTSNTELKGGSWSTTKPTFVSGRYYWTRQMYQYLDGTTKYTDPICVTGAQGEKGETGPQGDKGDKGDKGDTGAQGIQGCLYRVTQWTADMEYRNDINVVSNDVRYVDIVIIPNPALVTRGTAYRCKVTHVSTANNIPGTSGGATYWEALNSMAPIYTPLLLADNAVITLLQSNSVVVMKEDGTTVNAALGAGEYPLWIGATDPRKANFSVDDKGRATMKEATIEGKVIAGSAEGQRVELQPDNKAMKIYDESGAETASYEGNSYNDISEIYAGTEGEIIMLFDSGAKTMDKVDFKEEEIAISDYAFTNAPSQFVINGYLYSYYSTTAIQGLDDTTTSDFINPDDSGLIGPIVRPNASARITLYLDTYSDMQLTDRIGRQQIATCGFQDGGVDIISKKIITTTGGYHILTISYLLSTSMVGATAIVKWGGTTKGKPDISGIYSANFYMSKYFANGFCLGLSDTDYVMAYNQGGGKGMRLVMENNRYGLSLSNKGIQHRHHGGDWISMPLFIMKSYCSFSSATGTYSLSGTKSFDGQAPTLWRSKEGHVRLTYPNSWVELLPTLSTNNLIVNVVGYGVSASATPVKANIRTITSAYIEITLSDNETLNDGAFMIEMSLLE